MSGTDRDTLRRILSVVQKTSVLVDSQRPRLQLFPSSLAASAVVPPLHLPYPDDLVDSIQNKRLPAHVLNAISRKVHDWILGVQTLYSENFAFLCRKLAQDAPQNSLLSTRLASAYESRYLTWLTSSLSQYISQIPDKIESDKKRPVFNVKYTPILEKYFQLNAYPSSNERRCLAQKSGMTTRQIEVWFQNHRNRSKKDGIILARRPTGHSLISLEELESDVLGRLSPSWTDDEISDDEPMFSDKPSRSSTHPFYSPSPEHAFPAPYPTRCSYEPFPLASGKRTFPPPEWMRVPSSAPISSFPVDVDELAAQFATKLSFRETVGRINKHKNEQSISHHQPWFCSTVVIPSAAPHPSLTEAFTSCPVPQTTRRYSPFPSSLTTTPNRRPRKPRLPRRLPDWSRLSSLPAKISSRTTSLESISSCDSSSSNASINLLVTPPLTPLQEPELLCSGFFHSLNFEFPNLPAPFDGEVCNKSFGNILPVFSPFQYATSS